MAFDSIEDLMKPKMPVAKDPNAPAKPFGDTPIDPLTGHPIYGNRVTGTSGGPKIGDSHMGQHATLLRERLEDGKVKIYQDPKAIAERVEIQVPEGLVVIYKDYGFAKTLAHYKRIDILGIDGQLRGSIDMIPQDRTVTHTAYRFFYEGSEIGKGNGDIGLFVAQKLVSRNVAPRSGMGTGIDDEIITTIQHVLASKRA